MRIVLICLLFLCACEGSPSRVGEDALTLAVLMPLPEAGGLRELEWAVENVNTAGGILGHRPLRLRYEDTAALTPEAVVSRAEALANDPTVVAVIGPGGAEEMLAVATVMVRAKKPLVSFTSTSGEVLRAFQGSKYIWRTKLTDTAQVEWLVREARRLGARRPGLVTSLDAAGSTFFHLFGFLALSEGYTEADIVIETYGDDRPCEAAMAAAYEAGVDRLIAVPNSPEAFTCIVEAHAAHRGPLPGAPPELPGSLPPGTPNLAAKVRLVVADVGLETNKPLEALGEKAIGVEGWNAAPAPDSGFSEAWMARFGVGHPNNAAAAYDAVLLLALGLEKAKGEGGEALADGIAAVVAGRGTPVDWRTPGIQSALRRLRAGEDPNLTGASGALEYNATQGVDLQAGTFAHWRVLPPLQYDRQVTLGPGGDEPPPDLAARPPPGSFVAPPTGQEFTPEADHSRLAALLVAGSGTWSNYRHQADALRQYQRLRAAGVPDTDIVMIGADDLAHNAENTRPGEVRNLPGGPDVYAGAVYDYTPSVGAEGLGRILLGVDSGRLPTVLHTDAGTNLLIFLAGHGGVNGLGLGANTTEAGVSGGGDVLHPSDLRVALCTLRRENRVRRVLVVIESCYSGAFGDADYGGIEAGCPDGAPLEGVLVVTAATTKESSLAAGYDAALGAWVGDEFALAFSARLDRQDTPSLLGVYRDTYLDVSGSHVSVYNTAAYGNLDRHFADEFYTVPSR